MENYKRGYKKYNIYNIKLEIKVWSRKQADWIYKLVKYRTTSQMEIIQKEKKTVYKRPEKPKGRKYTYKTVNGDLVRTRVGYMPI